MPIAISHFGQPFWNRLYLRSILPEDATIGDQGENGGRMGSGWSGVTVPPPTEGGSGFTLLLWMKLTFRIYRLYQTNGRTWLNRIHGVYEQTHSALWILVYALLVTDAILPSIPVDRRDFDGARGRKWHTDLPQSVAELTTTSVAKNWK